MLPGSLSGEVTKASHNSLLDTHIECLYTHLNTALEDYCRQPDVCVSSINYLKLDIPAYVPPSQIIEENLVGLICIENVNCSTTGFMSVSVRTDWVP